MDHIAIDIGASGGKVISGKIVEAGEGGRPAPDHIQFTEIHRFENRTFSRRGHRFWDMDQLVKEVLRGLTEARRRGITNCTLGIDTWGVDYVLVDREGERIQDAYCYRDSRTDGAMASFLEKIPRETVYEKTGIQFLPFNTLYQLSVHDPGELKRAHKVLLIPDYLYFRLGGGMFTEMTNASTTQLVNIRTGEFDPELLAAVGLERRQCAELVAPGKALGRLRADLRDRFRLPDAELVSVATHDTASAVLATPGLDERSAYVSSGTWSLVGIESQTPCATAAARELNFTNERGAFGTFRFLKNIAGLWLLQEVRRNWGGRLSFDELLAAAAPCEAFRFILDVNAGCFLNPDNMAAAVQEYCGRTGQGTPHTPGEIVRCLVDSLALRYRYTIEEIEELAGVRISAVNITGGGVRNRPLSEATAEVTGRRVIAGPVEGTAAGNIVMQLIARGEITSLAEARELLKKSFSTYEIRPRGRGAPDAVREKFMQLLAAGG